VGVFLRPAGAMNAGIEAALHEGGSTINNRQVVRDPGESIHGQGFGIEDIREMIMAGFRARTPRQRIIHGIYESSDYDFRTGDALLAL